MREPSGKGISGDCRFEIRSIKMQKQGELVFYLKRTFEGRCRQYPKKQDDDKDQKNPFFHDANKIAISDGNVNNSGLSKAALNCGLK